jgi:hypothetical protein
MATAGVVRDVGETLMYLLRAGIPSAVVASANIRVATPDEFGDLDGLNVPAISIFLYRVAINPTMRNAPKRTLPDGSIARPLLPIELGYLVTPWAPQTGDEHLVAGHVLRVFYDRPELGPTDLQGTSWASGDTAQIILESLPTDEHYRIWETSKMPYRLSLTYTVRVIGIEPSESVVAPPVIAASFGAG